jgi:hypothetical protein
MLNVRLQGNRIHVGERFAVSFQRTLRIPDDGNHYPLPPGLGLLPVHAVAEYRRHTPDWWQDDEFFIPMYQREAMWLGFDGDYWKPNAVQIGVGGIDAISGEPWRPGLTARPQNYIVCPDQPWLDGINTESGLIRQFVAMPLGSGYTIEGQLTGSERTGGIQFVVFEPKPGRFPAEAPPGGGLHQGTAAPKATAVPKAELGLAAGGRMEQEIYRDAYGLDTWDGGQSAAVSVHIVNSEQYEAMTGRPAPDIPVSAEVYTKHGLPWFEFYDESRVAIEGSARLAGVRSTAEIDRARTGRTSPDDEPVAVTEEQMRKLKGKPPFSR